MKNKKADTDEVRRKLWNFEGLAHECDQCGQEIDYRNDVVTPCGRGICYHKCTIRHMNICKQCYRGKKNNFTMMEVEPKKRKVGNITGASEVAKVKPNKATRTN